MASKRDGALVVALAAALIGLTCGVIAFLGPADLHRTRVTWRPARDGLDRPLALLGAYPHRLSIAMSCAALRTSPPTTALVKTAATPASSQGLAVVADPDAVHLDVGERAGLLSLPVPGAGPCSVAATFVAGLEMGVSLCASDLKPCPAPLRTNL